MHNIRRLNVETQSDQPLLSADSAGALISRPIVSPDAKKIAIRWGHDPGGLWVITLNKRSEAFLHKDLFPFGWSPDGALIYAYKPGAREILRIGVKNSKQPDSIISVPGSLDFSSVTISPDGEKIIAAESQSVNDIWLMRNFDPQPAR